MYDRDTLADNVNPPVQATHNFYRKGSDYTSHYRMIFLKSNITAYITFQQV